jgi:hypothetical protein
VMCVAIVRWHFCCRSKWQSNAVQWIIEAFTQAIFFVIDSVLGRTW